jgi:hypothetical protein
VKYLRALLLIATLGAQNLGANTCLPPRLISVDAVCGHAINPAGEDVPGVRLQLRNQQNDVIDVLTDSAGDFFFGLVAKGKYHLTVDRKDGWVLSWPLRVTTSDTSAMCKTPLTVKLGLMHVKIPCRKRVIDRIFVSGFMSGSYRAPRARNRI